MCQSIKIVIIVHSIRVKVVFTWSRSCLVRYFLQSPALSNRVLQKLNSWVNPSIAMTKKRNTKEKQVAKTRDATTPQFYRPSLGGLDNLPPLSYFWTVFFLATLAMGVYDIVSSYFLLESVNDSTCLAKYADAPRQDGKSPLKTMAFIALNSCVSIQLWIIFFAFIRFRKQCRPFSWTKLRVWANGITRFKSGDELETFAGRLMFRFAFITMFTQDLLQLIILFYQQYAAQTPYSFTRDELPPLEYYYFVNNQIKGLISGVSFSITWSALIDKFLCASKRHIKSKLGRCCKSLFRNLCFCVNLSAGLLSVLIWYYLKFNSVLSLFHFSYLEIMDGT